MSRVEEANNLIKLMGAYTDAVPTTFISDGTLDRFKVTIMMDIMMSLAVIADSVNKEEKND